MTVATSDGLEQIIVRGQGCSLLSAKGLKEEITQVIDNMMEEYADKQKGNKSYLFDTLSEDTAKQIQDMKHRKEDL